MLRTDVRLRTSSAWFEYAVALHDAVAPREPDCGRPRETVQWMPKRSLSRKRASVSRLRRTVSGKRAFRLLPRNLTRASWPGEPGVQHDAPPVIGLSERPPERVAQVCGRLDRAAVAAARAREQRVVDGG